MADSPPAAASAAAAVSPLAPPPPALKQARTRGLIVSVVVNAVLPWLIYKALKRWTSVPELYALAATSIPSTIDAVYGVARRKRLDFLAGFTLFTIVVSLALVALGGSPKLYLVRESLFTGVLGAAMLVSLPWRMPLMFYMLRYVMTGGDAALTARFDAVWARREGRMLTGVYTAMFGVVLVLEAALRIDLVFHMSNGRFLAVSPFVFYGGMGLLFLGIAGYSRWYGERYPDSPLMAYLEQQNEPPPPPATALPESDEPR